MTSNIDGKVFFLVPTTKDSPRLKIVTKSSDRLQDLLDFLSPDEAGRVRLIYALFNDQIESLQHSLEDKELEFVEFEKFHSYSIGSLIAELQEAKKESEALRKKVAEDEELHKTVVGQFMHCHQRDLGCLMAQHHAELGKVVFVALSVVGFFILFGIAALLSILI